MAHQQRKIGTSTYRTEFIYFLQLLYSVFFFFGLFNVVFSADYTLQNDWKKAGTRASPCGKQDKIELLEQELHSCLEN